MRLLLRQKLLFLSVIFFVPLLNAQREKFSAEDLAVIEAQWPAAKKDNTGMRYIIERPGTGDMPVPGQQVSVLYTGKLLSGATFDKSMDAKRPFVFRVGRESVIPGWDYTIQQMKVGERRLVIIPPELGYGSRGQAPRIPRNATLVFVIDFLEIKPD